MAGDSAIIQRIKLEGGAEIEAALNNIAKAGQDAFNKLKTASEGLKGESDTGPVGAIASMAKRAGVSFDEMADRVRRAKAEASGAAGGFHALGEGLSNTSRFAKAAEIAGAALGTSMRGLGSVGQAAFNGLTTLNFGIGGFVEHIKNAGVQTLKAVGIIGGLPAALYAASVKASNTSYELEHQAEAAGTTTGKLQEFKSSLATAGVEGGNYERALHMVSAASAQVEKAFYDAEISTRKFYQSQRDGASDLSTNQARAIEDFETRIRRAGKSMSDPAVSRAPRRSGDRAKEAPGRSGDGAGALLPRSATEAPRGRRREARASDERATYREVHIHQGCKA